MCCTALLDVYIVFLGEKTACDSSLCTKDTSMHNHRISGDILKCGLFFAHPRNVCCRLWTGILTSYLHSYLFVRACTRLGVV